jgi:transposase InsO family protein
VLKCVECAFASRLKAKPAPVPTVPVLPGPHRKLVMDVFGPISRDVDLVMDTSTGVSVTPYPRHFLTLVDVYSGMRAAYPLVTHTTAAIRMALWVHFQSFGLPTIICSDNASTFKALQSWLRQLGVEMKFCPVYAPERHGLIERIHRDLNTALRASLTTGDDFWVEQLFHRVLLQNSTSYKMTNGNISPAELSLRFSPNFPHVRSSGKLRTLISTNGPIYIETMLIFGW